MNLVKKNIAKEENISEEITFDDFEERENEEDVSYFVYTDGEVQICLEPCAGGFCVGIYDGNDYILAEKKCTNLPSHDKLTQRMRAVELANTIYQEWKSKNVNDGCNGTSDQAITSPPE